MSKYRTERFFAWYPVWTNKGFKWWIIVRKRTDISTEKNKVYYRVI